jgi:hypothetical protein
MSSFFLSFNAPYSSEEHKENPPVSVSLLPVLEKLLDEKWI